jgi:hypothetical protein
MDSNELRAVLTRAGHCKVRILSRTPCPAASALFDYAAYRLGKTSWSVGEWLALLAVLDSTEATVAEWLSAPFDAGPCLSCAA